MIICSVGIVDFLAFLPTITYCFLSFMFQFSQSFLKDFLIHNCRSNLSLSTLNHQIHLLGSNVDQIFISETERWIVHQTFPSTQCFFIQFSILDFFCGRLIDHNAKRNVLQVEILLFALSVADLKDHNAKSYISSGRTSLCYASCVL